MRLKRLACSILFCGIFLLLSAKVYDVLSWKDTAGDYYSSMDTFHALDEDLVDVLFLGSSRCYCAVNNAMLWEDYGICSMNLAISGQDMAGTYHSLVDALKTQSPDVVCIEAYGLTFEGYSEVGNLYRNTLPFRFSLNSLQAAREMVTEGDPRDYWLKWPVIHTRYKELGRLDFSERPPFVGYHAEFVTEAIPASEAYDGQESIAPSSTIMDYLQRILSLSQEKGFQLLFFAAPYAAPRTDQAIYHYAQDYLAQYDVPFLNLVNRDEELGIQADQDFINWFHTNYFGAQKVTRILGQYLATNYLLYDRRNDPRYDLWNRDAQARGHEVQNQLTIRQTFDLYAYLDMLADLKGYTIFLSTDGEYLSDYMDIQEGLENLGIKEEFYEGRHVWILRDGKVLFCSSGTDYLETGDLFNGEYVASAVDDVHSVLINRLAYDKTTDGINIIVYDDVLGEVADAIGFYAPLGYAVAK